MKIRIFGSDNCKDCLRAMLIIKKSKVPYVFYDALDDKNDEICDENDVDELPHIQFIDDNDNILIEHIGPIYDDDFIEYLSDYSSL